MNLNRMLRRGGFLAALAIFTVLVLLIVGILFLGGRAYVRVELPQSYWLVVRDCEDTTAAAVLGQSYVSGGAGYLFEANGRKTVALSCYYSQSAAYSVRTTLAGKGVETQVVALSPSAFELAGGACAQEERIIANAETADSCTRILYEAANGLERAQLSQEEARGAVRGAMGSLSGLQQGNRDRIYKRWNAELVDIQRKGAELAEGILFARDLRNLQVRLCVLVASAADYFT